MSNIKDIKRYEIEEMYDFLRFIEDYGHVYHYPNDRLDAPFKKIMEGMEEVRVLMDDSWEM